MWWGSHSGRRCPQGLPAGTPGDDVREEGKKVTDSPGSLDSGCKQDLRSNHHLLHHSLQLEGAQASLGRFCLVCLPPVMFSSFIEL